MGLSDVVGALDSKHGPVVQIAKAAVLGPAQIPLDTLVRTAWPSIAELRKMRFQRLVRVRCRAVGRPGSENHHSLRDHPSWTLPGGSQTRV